jgi:hypothetical protein
MSLAGPESHTPIVEAITQNVIFEPGISAENLRFLPSVGFLATQEGAGEHGGVEVAGFIGSWNGKYSLGGGYTNVGQGVTVAECFNQPVEAMIRYSQEQPHGRIEMGNHPGVLMERITELKGQTIELWAAAVHRTSGRGTRLVSNAELGRATVTRGDVRRVASRLYSGSCALGWLSVGRPESPHLIENDAVIVEGRKGRVAFQNNLGAERTDAPSFRKLGVLSPAERWIVI